MKLFSVKGVGLFTLFLIVTFGVTVGAQVVNVSKGNIALDGYDVVAYHTENEAIKGVRGNSTKWNDATWHFASDRNLRLFLADPERYAPQYGGYCAFAAANNAIAPVDPEAFGIVDDKLYLNFSKSVQRRWSSRQNGYIRIADQNWPELLIELQTQ